MLLAGAGVATGLLLGGDDAQTARRRANPALAPFVDRIALGEGASAGRVAANPTFAFVTDGPNREVIQVLSSSRKVLRRIRLRSPPHDLGLTSDGQHLWVTLEDRQLVDIDLRDARADLRPARHRRPLRRGHQRRRRGALAGR